MATEARFRIYLSLLTVTVLAGCASCETDHVTREKCQRLRDHVVDTQLAKLPSRLAPPTLVIPPDPRTAGSQEPTHVKLAVGQPDIAGHRAAMTQALGEAYLTSCLKNLSAAQLKCALDAADSASVAECQRSRSK